MNNKVELENSKIKTFKTVSIVLLILALCCALMLFVAIDTHTKNLNGFVNKQECVIKEVDDKTITLDDGKTYNISPCKGDVDWSEYIDKTVTIVRPENASFLAKNWVVGLECDGEVVIDCQTVISDHKENDVVMFAVFGTLLGVFFAGFVAVKLIMRKLPKTQEVELCDVLASINAIRQPVCKNAKIVTSIFFGIGIALVITMILTSLIGEKKLDEKTMDIVQDSFLGALGFVSIVGLIVVPFAVRKTEIDFYVKNFPFNFDMPSSKMRKSLKAEAIKMAEDERLRYPDFYPEGANGYAAEFTKDGIILRDADSIYDQYIAESRQEVFSDMQNENEDDCMFKHKFTYEQLKLVAVPVYRKYSQPLTVIIKSRLENGEGGLQKDVHFIFDSNLLRTIRKFDVDVERLDDILENLEKLLKTNCKKAKRKVRF